MKTLPIILLAVLLPLAANAATIVTVGRARFSFYSPSLVRLEWSAGVFTWPFSFEDRPSLVVVNRDAGGSNTKVKRVNQGANVTLTTDGLEIQINGKDCRDDIGFDRSPGCIQISYPYTEPKTKSTGQKTWAPPLDGNLTGPGNLKGSLETYDCYVGPTECRKVYEKRMQRGLLSRDGWVVIDESRTPLFVTRKNGSIWRAERSTRAGWSQNDTDWLFFGHGNLGHKESLADFVAMAGDVTLMPQAAYGVWWSRYWTYDEAGISEVVEGFKSRDLPLHMLVLDMDWHGETPDPGGEPAGSPLLSCNSGWGGYTWNRSLFVSPVAFQKKVHEVRSRK
jgi:hypothetical protein